MLFSKPQHHSVDQTSPIIPATIYQCVLPFTNHLLFLFILVLGFCFLLAAEKDKYVTFTMT